MIAMLLMQRADAAFLFVIALSCIIVAEEERTLHRLYRASIYFVAAASFAQALWLLGFWVPGAAGYPLPRLTLDGALAIAAALRAVMTLAKRSPARRRGSERAPGMQK